jgi:hypothetical protein
MLKQYDTGRVDAPGTSSVAGFGLDDDCRRRLLSTIVVRYLE